jgi:hypothetical protein
LNWALPVLGCPTSAGTSVNTIPSVSYADLTKVLLRRIRGLAGARADDAFFADGGKRVVVNLEHQQVIEVIDRETKTVTWAYGSLGKRGAVPGPEPASKPGF